MAGKNYVKYQEGRRVIKEEVTSQEQFDRLADREAKGEIAVKEISVTTKRRKDTK